MGMKNDKKQRKWFRKVARGEIGDIARYYIGRYKKQENEVIMLTVALIISNGLLILYISNILKDII